MDRHQIFFFPNFLIRMKHEERIMKISSQLHIFQKETKIFALVQKSDVDDDKMRTIVFAGNQAWGNHRWDIMTAFN